jgi:hypothetical protein
MGMGLYMECALYLQQRGYLTREKNKILDIGPQNVYFATEHQILAFLKNQGRTISDEKLNDEVSRLAYFSTPRRNERTTLFSEVTDLTNIEYNSYDVCPGLKTHILDLNFDSIPQHDIERYDVVINFGTTEHVFNQWNCFAVMHDALRVGGIIYHRLPVSGYLEHGYFCYTPLFFRELAAANRYEIMDLFLTNAGTSNLHASNIDVRDNKKLETPKSAEASQNIVPQFDIHVLMRKTRSAPFRCALEISTAHAALDPRMKWRYRDGGVSGAAAAVGEAVMRVARSLRSRIRHHRVRP